VSLLDVLWSLVASAMTMGVKCFTVDKHDGPQEILSLCGENTWSDIASLHLSDSNVYYAFCL